MYTIYRFMFDVALSFALSGLVYLVSEAFEWFWPYWLCLLVAAIIVFLGEVLIVTGSDGNWLD